MKAHDISGYRSEIVQIKGTNGTIKVSKSLFDNYKYDVYNDCITLKNGMSLEILPQFKHCNRFMASLAVITNNPDLNKEKLKTDAEVSIIKVYNQTQIESKNAQLIIHSTNNKIDSIFISNPKNSTIKLDTDANDDVAFYSNKIDSYIYNNKY